MKRIKSIIIDDEPGCISNLRYYLEKYCAEIDIVKTESRLSECVKILNNDIDVAFLDVEVVNDNMFNILSQVSNAHFDIVFVTAYEKYALQAFDVDVLDYILKPLRKENILSCYEKILRRYSVNSNPNLTSNEKHTSTKLILRQGEKVYSIDLNDIVYMAANGAYTNICIHKDNKKELLTLSRTLSDIQNEYSSIDFIKIHRSFVINKNRIMEIHKKNNATVKMSTGDIIPVARRRWVEFLFTNKL